MYTSSSSTISDWVLKQVEDIQSSVGISDDGFEEQFKALLIAIKSGHSPALKQASKKER